jgi:hypothetical protein
VRGGHPVHARLVLARPRRQEGGREVHAPHPSSSQDKDRPHQRHHPHLGTLQEVITTKMNINSLRMKMKRMKKMRKKKKKKQDGKRTRMDDEDEVDCLLGFETSFNFWERT